MFLFEAIIFDMDGVVVPSTPFIRKVFTKLLAEYGVLIPFSDLKRFMGRSLKDQMAIWKAEYNLPSYVTVKDFSIAADKLELAMMKKEITSDPALLLLVAAAKERGVKIALATSSIKFRVPVMLDLVSMSNVFDVIVTAEDVTYHKPHPEIFLTAAKRLGVNPLNCVVIEDAIQGIDAARAAHMKSIGMLTEFLERKDLREADLIVSSFQELNLGILESLWD